YHYPGGWPDAAEVHGNWAIANCDSVYADGMVYFHVADDSVPPPDFEVTWLIPPDFVWSGCEDQEIVFLVEPYVPDTLTVIINGVLYGLADPELSVSGDTVTFMPSMVWVEGIVNVYVLGEHLSFGIDLTPPYIAPIYPTDGATVPADPLVVRFNIHEPITASGLDEESIDIAVFVNGSSAGTYGTSDPGVGYIEPELEFEPSTAGITLEAGDTVQLIVAASDLVETEYCGPNTRIEDLRFYIADPDSDRHYLSGFVVDSATGAPLEGIFVHVFNYLGGIIPDLMDTTGADGSYSIGVYNGIYTLGAFDPLFDYRPTFFHDRADLLEADPIFVDASSPSIISLDTLHMPEMGPGPTLYSISGTITEEDDGPIDAAYIIAISSEDEDIEDAAISNPSGDYDIKVSPGDYYVLAFHENYFPEFYEGSIDWSSADTIHVTADVTGVDIDLNLMDPAGGDGELFGYVYGDSGSRYLVPEPLRGTRVYLLDASDMTPVAFTVSRYDGSYHFEDIAEGTYLLLADKINYLHTTPYCEVILDTTLIMDINMLKTTPVAETPHKSESFGLETVAPNPFNSACGISYTIGTPGKVVIEAYDITGHKIEVIDERNLSPGRYLTVWCPDDISSGVYLIKLTCNGRSQTARTLLIK
ncbi:hypothetical protein DRQ36_10330, partial [bacterium]